MMASIQEGLQEPMTDTSSSLPTGRAPGNDEGTDASQEDDERRVSDKQ